MYYTIIHSVHFQPIRPLSSRSKFYKLIFIIIWLRVCKINNLVQILNCRRKEVITGIEAKDVTEMEVKDVIETCLEQQSMSECRQIVNF